MMTDLMQAFKVNMSRDGKIVVDYSSRETCSVISLFQVACSLIPVKGWWRSGATQPPVVKAHIPSSGICPVMDFHLPPGAGGVMRTRGKARRIALIILTGVGSSEGEPLVLSKGAS